MPYIKPQKWSIPVTYKGIRFRSHLEARWAVFFDELGLKYEYEPALERVRGILYAPDFRLEFDDFDLMVEIKPKEPEESELIKAAAWAKELDNVLILFGPLEPSPGGVRAWLMAPPEGVIHDYTVPVLEKGYRFCECPKCGRIDVCRLGEIPDGCRGSCFSQASKEDLALAWRESHRSLKLIAAYTKARTFQFEPSVSRARPKYPEGPPTLRMVEFVMRLLERAGEEVPPRDEIESMRFGEVKAWIAELLDDDNDPWR